MNIPSNQDIGFYDLEVYNYNTNSWVLTSNIFEVLSTIGCTDSLAVNFDAFAIQDDGSCQYCDISATIIQSDPTSSSSCDGYIFGNISFNVFNNFNTISDFNMGQVLSNTNIATGLCSGVYMFEVFDLENCIYTEIISLGNVYGCTDSSMINYDQYANTDDGSCVPYIYGCTDSTQFNYDITANTDDEAIFRTYLMQIQLHIIFLIALLIQMMEVVFIAI